jgi:hypothetical protein
MGFPMGFCQSYYMVNHGENYDLISMVTQG